MLNLISEKKRKLNSHPTSKPLPRPVFLHGSKQNAGSHISGKGKPAEEQFKRPAASNLLTNLANMNRKSRQAEPVETVRRTTGFSDQPQEIQPPEPEEDAPKRDDRLALVETLEPGPYKHNAPLEDPDFEKLEPHSGINLMYVHVLPSSAQTLTDLGRARYLTKNLPTTCEAASTSRRHGSTPPFVFCLTSRDTMCLSLEIGSPSPSLQKEALLSLPAPRSPLKKRKETSTLISEGGRARIKTPLAPRRHQGRSTST